MKLSVSKTARIGLIAAGAGAAALSWAGPSTKGLDQIAALKAGGFLENKGQWDSRALFYMGTPGKDVWISRDGITLDLYKNDVPKGSAIDEGTRRGHVVKFEFAGASASATPVGAVQRPNRVDFMKGQGASEFVTSRQFGEAYVSDLYRGVHLRNYKDKGDFRYDLVVMPGADASQIRFNVKGADMVRPDTENGGLVIRTSMGDVRQSAPFVYQQVGEKRAAVPASFKVDGNSVSFSLGKFNKNLPLVIDPLVYGSYMGADSVPFTFSGSETLNGASADSRGNLYLAGTTSTTNFPILQGPYGVSLKGSTDAFIARMAGDAYALDYCAFIGGTGSDNAISIKIAEAAGIVWMGGETTSDDFPGATNAGPGGGARSWWFMRWSLGADGSLSPDWSFYEFADFGTIGAFGSTSAAATRWSDMGVAADGSLYVGGMSPQVAAKAEYVPFIAGSTQGGVDGFIIKYNPDGTRFGARKIGGPGSESLGRFGVLPNGGIVLTGSVGGSGNQDTSTVPVASAVFATTSNVNWVAGRLKRNQDAYIVALWPNLSIWYSGFIGGASLEVGIAAAADPAGNAYVLGQTNSFDFPRTPGVFDQDFSTSGEAFVTKITTARQIGYSTGLRHSGNVIPNVIRADARGVAVVGGTVSFVYPGGTPPQPTVPGSIATTADAIDGAYGGGDESVEPPNNYAGTAAGTVAVGAAISSTEGFVQFLNSTGTNLLYGSYIGEESDDTVTDIHMDAVGSTWVVGNSVTSPLFQAGPKSPIGLGAHITANAFKATADGARDAYAIKLRVGLPVMQSLTLSSNAIAGGLGASTNATVNLRNPAPAGGVVINASLSDPTITSFAPAGGQATRSVLIPAGATSATFPVYSSPVTIPSPADIRVTLDNDFLIARVTINPWLDDFTVTPSSMIGGNQLSVIVRLFQNATQPVRVQVATGSSNVTLPANSEIVVPAGTNTATVVMDTAGVDGPTLVSIDGTLLGVTRSGSTVLDRATMIAASFSPSRVLSGEPSTLTVLFNGKVGTARTVSLAHTGGVAGLLVQPVAGGSFVALPTTVDVPAQASQVVIPVTAPTVTTPSSTTVTATEGLQSASGTLFVDDIDIARVDIVPGIDVLGGTVLTGTVTLTRPAGQNPLVFNISSNNATAGSLAAGSQTVTVPVGSQTSSTFTFNTNIVSSVQNVDISVSRTNFTTNVTHVTVRPIVLSVNVDPNSVLGGNSASVTLSISTPAPAGGLTVDLSSSDSSVATVSPAQVTIPAGSTVPTVGTTITVSTVAVVADVPVTITGQLGTFSSGSDSLLVRAPAVTSLVVNPAEIAGGSSAIGTVTIEGPAPAGFVLDVTSSAAQATVPTTVTIPEGATSATFTITTAVVPLDVDATITVTGSSSSASADIRIVAASVASVTFSPNIVRGGGNSVCTIRLTRTAPAGGTVVNIASDQPGLAWSTVTSVTVPAGAVQATVPIRTNRVARRASVGFTATVVATGRTARGFLGIMP